MWVLYYPIGHGVEIVDGPFNTYLEAERANPWVECGCGDPGCYYEAYLVGAI
jgi:hypothetical protein